MFRLHPWPVKVYGHGHLSGGFAPSQVVFYFQTCPTATEPDYQDN